MEAWINYYQGMKSYTFDDVLILPNYSDIESRSEIDTTAEFLGYLYKTPIISANMDYITGSEMMREMHYNGALGILHRFMPWEDQKEIILNLSSEQPIYFSVGIRNLDATLGNIDEVAKYATGVCIDVAHGHHEKVAVLITAIKGSSYTKHLNVIAGNVATKEGVEFLIDAGADAVKVGIGAGCLAGDSRILLSNGFYCDIKDVVPGMRVIDMNGLPQTVLAMKFSGTKKTSKIRHTQFRSPLSLTPDHKLLVGDLSTLSCRTMVGRGYARSLSQTTRFSEEKIKWASLDDGIKRFTGLMPSTISWELPDGIKIDLRQHSMRNKYLKRYNLDVENSHALGYMFGFYLGDGTSRVHSWKGGIRGNVSWSLGKDQECETQALVKAVFEVTGVAPTVTHRRNMAVVNLYSIQWARIFGEFGKRTDKALPERFLCRDTEYLSGLFKGLVDSDGDVDSGRIGFTNTSPKLVELFGILAFMLKGSFPSSATKSKSIGTLVGADIDRVKQSYRSRLDVSHVKRHLNGYQIVKVLSTEEGAEQETYDLEIENSHSFIANNLIVHNSVCTTRTVAGIGVPQLSAIIQASKCAKRSNTPIIADGGIRTSGDVVKALAAGATMVMIGNLFAGTNETPGDTFSINGRQYKKYRGQASFGVNGDRYVKEGIDGFVPAKGPVAPVLHQIRGGLQSAMSYVGARDLDEFTKKAKFTKVSSHTLMENSTRVTEMTL